MTVPEREPSMMAAVFLIGVLPSGEERQRAFELLEALTLWNETHDGDKRDAGRQCKFAIALRAGDSPREAVRRVCIGRETQDRFVEVLAEVLREGAVLKIDARRRSSVLIGGPRPATARCRETAPPA
jgi:hypothetical protein